MINKDSIYNCSCGYIGKLSYYVYENERYGYCPTCQTLTIIEKIFQKQRMRHSEQ